jgi:TM2 domain-containing membrane protein YozV
MKKLTLSLSVIAVIASCSAPKYSYNFSTHKYQSVSKNGDKEVLNVVDEQKSFDVSELPKIEETLVASTKPVASESAVSAKPLSLNLNKNQAKLVDARQVKKDLKADRKFVRSEVKKQLKQLKAPSSVLAEGKSQVAAILLAFFVGVLGIHRFYLGYTVIGVIQLLTLGGFGIWALIDFIRIIIGDLKPKNGEYTKTI